MCSKKQKLQDIDKQLAYIREEAQLRRSLLMGDPKEFMTVKRVENGYRPITERIRDYAEVETLLPKRNVSSRRPGVWTAALPFLPLAGPCPVGEHHAPNGGRSPGNWKAAYEILQDTNNFPEFTGRICPAPKSACVVAINDNSVTIRDKTNWQ